MGFEEKERGRKPVDRPASQRDLLAVEDRLKEVLRVAVDASREQLSHQLGDGVNAVIDQVRQNKKGKILVSFTVVTGGREAVLLDPVSVKSNESQPMHLLADTTGTGVDDPSVVLTPTSSDEAQVGIAPDPDGDPRHFLLLTPLTEGSARITIKGAGFEDTEFDFNYVPFVPKQIVVNFPAPIPD